MVLIRFKGNIFAYINNNNTFKYKTLSLTIPIPIRISIRIRIPIPIVPFCVVVPSCRKVVIVVIPNAGRCDLYSRKYRVSHHHHHHHHHW